MERQTKLIHREPWNKDKLVGQKAPLKLKEIWSIRIRLELSHRIRDLALFNLEIKMSYTIEQADILIDLAQQTLYLPKHNKFYVISSGKNGIGEQENSGKTPRGWHRVAQKIGQKAAKNSVFIARQPTGEIYNQKLAEQFPERDWILSRILWLDGLEVITDCP